MYTFTWASAATLQHTSNKSTRQIKRPGRKRVTNSEAPTLARTNRELSVCLDTGPAPSLKQFTCLNGTPGNVYGGEEIENLFGPVRTRSGGRAELSESTRRGKL